MRLLFWGFALSSIVSHASPFAMKSVQTSIEESKCIKIKSHEYDRESVARPYEYQELECPGLGGYQVFYSGKDQKYLIGLKYNGQVINFEAPSTLHEIAQKNIEWRVEQNLNETAEFKALLFQVNMIDENSEALKKTEVIYVVRLNGEKSCLLSKSPDWKSATEIADNPKSKCSKD